MEMESKPRPARSVEIVRMGSLGLERGCVEVGFFPPRVRVAMCGVRFGRRVRRRWERRFADSVLEVKIRMVGAEEEVNDPEVLFERRAALEGCIDDSSVNFSGSVGSSIELASEELSSEELSSEAELALESSEELSSESESVSEPESESSLDEVASSERSFDASMPPSPP